MIKLLRYMKTKDWCYIAVVFVFVIVSVWCTLTMPDYMTKITQLVETGGEMNEVWHFGLIMLLFALGDAVCTVIVGFCTSHVAASFSKNLRKAVYDKVVGFSMEEINNFSTSSLVTRSTNDIVQIVMVISMGLQMILRAPIIAIWAVFKILDKGWQWILVTAIAVAVVLVTLVIVLSLVTPKFRMIQKLTDRMNLVTRENLTGVRVVRAYNAEHYQEEKFDRANQDITNTHLFTGKTMAVLMPTMQFVMSTTSLFVYWIGANIILHQDNFMAKIDTFSKLVVFMAYAIQIIFAFMMVSMIFMFLPRAQVSAGRIEEVLHMKTRIIDGKTTSSGQTRGTVEFRNVSFRYPQAQESVLSGITFTAGSGDTIAFIGSTGSGKSTLVNLVPRFFDVTGGEVLVDGVNVKDYALETLRSKIGYVSQKAILFKGTIASNVDYGSEEGHKASEEEIIHALEVAQGRDIIEKQEKGIYAEVAQGGTNFSGGQKQRLSIARAILRSSPLVLLDEATASLDIENELLVKRAIENLLRQKRTVIMIAHTMPIVENADQILVLDDGRIAEAGSHEELRRLNGKYERMWKHAEMLE